MTQRRGSKLESISRLKLTVRNITTAQRRTLARAKQIVYKSGKSLELLGNIYFLWPRKRAVSTSTCLSVQESRARKKVQTGPLATTLS